MRHIYLDYNATTPLAPEVAAAMRSLMNKEYGNPSSRHWAGERAREAIDLSRSQVASLLGCESDEVVITSGGTEANNFALGGVFFAQRGNGTPHFIVSSVEHPSISKTVDFLERQGAEVTRVDVDQFGQIDADSVSSAIQHNTALISVMHANNEVGTLQPIAEISRVARERGVLLHTDAAQSVGKVLTKVDELGVDLLTVAGHKMYAPQGIGALFVRREVVLEPFMHGGGHERGRRAGTENVLEIVALGTAARLAACRDMNRVRELRDYFWQLLQERFGERVALNGHPKDRLPNTINVSFVGQLGHEILARIPTVAASTGSACHDGSYELSPVLRAMGVPESVGLGAIRFSLGENSTREEIDFVVEQLTKSLP